MLARTLLTSPPVTESNAFVLLCAEEDDLALVPWVHAARQRALAPEVVTGVDVDDAPLVGALGDTRCRLFVVLRSASLGPVRMQALEAAFARHRHPTQRLFALRIDAATHLAVDRIAAELAGTSRPRSDLSMVMTIDALFDEPVDNGPADGADLPMREVPTVHEALRLADRAAEREVTGQFDVSDETIALGVAPDEGPGAATSVGGWRRAAAWVAGLGLAIGSVGLAVAVASGDAGRAARTPQADAGGGAAEQVPPPPAKRAAAIPTEPALRDAQADAPAGAPAGDEVSTRVTPRRRAAGRAARVREGAAALPPVDATANAGALPTVSDVEGRTGDRDAAQREDEPVLARVIDPAAIESTPKDPAPTGTAPTGTAPKGTAPTGTAPTGTAPTGTAPKDTAPTGPVPKDPAPAPKDTAPLGTAPSEPAPSPPQR